MRLGVASALPQQFSLLAAGFPALGRLGPLRALPKLKSIATKSKHLFLGVLRGWLSTLNLFSTMWRVSVKISFNDFAACGAAGGAWGGPGGARHRSMHFCSSGSKLSKHSCDLAWHFFNGNKPSKQPNLLMSAHIWVSEGQLSQHLRYKLCGCRVSVGDLAQLADG